MGLALVLLRSFLCLLMMNSIFVYGKNNGSQLLDKVNWQEVELETNKALNRDDITLEKKFYLLLLAGRELYSLNVYERSAFFYKKALGMKVEKDKSEAYINLININKILNKKKKLIDVIKSAENYYKNNTAFLNPVIRKYLELRTHEVSEKMSDNKSYGQLFGYQLAKSDLKKIIIKKNYIKAFSMLNRDAIAKSKNLSMSITYDLLNVLVYKNKKTKLVCKKPFLKYPNSYTYSMLICGILIDYLKNNKISSTKMSELNNYFNKRFENKRYLYNALLNLK